MQNISINLAQAEQSDEIAVLVGELLNEIMTTIGSQAFNFNLEETTERLEDFIIHGKNHVFIVQQDQQIIGFATLYQSYALYAEGAFGTLAEFYVKPAYRSQKAGKALIDHIKTYAKQKNWTRLEVTTPPLPTFDQTLTFYQREGFEIAGGRKLKVALNETKP